MNFRTFIAIFSLLSSSFSFGQGIWTQKANFGGTARSGAAGFSIGSKGYIGTGTGSSPEDFWEWDQAANTWTQKANFGGPARQYPASFSVGSKGYIGTGNFMQDFWEYDPSLNSWTQKANFGGTGRRFATGFSIGSKGYIACGDDNGSLPYENDLWEYDPSANSWTQKSSMGIPHSAPASFVIGTKAYVGTGNSGASLSTVDFWEWDQAANTWTQKANLSGPARRVATGFSIGSYGYAGCGWNGSTYFNDFWRYDPSVNTWTQMANFGGSGRYGTVGFSIGNKGYYGTGMSSSGTTQDFWEYSPQPAATGTYVLSFDGSNDYVDIGTTAGNTGIRTIEFWFKPTITITPSISVPGESFVMRNDATQNKEYGVYIRGTDWSTNRGYLHLAQRQNGTLYEIRSDSSTWNAGQWYHFSGVIDPATGMKMYIDGVLQSNSDPAGTAPIMSSTELTAFGCWGDAFIRYYNGRMEDVRFWNRALSQSEVQTKMCQILSVANETGLVANWHFDEGSGSVVVDSAGIYNGTVNGPVWIVDSTCTTLPPPPVYAADTICDATFTLSTHDCVGDGVSFYSADSSLSATHYWYFGSMTNASPTSSVQKDPSGIIYSQSGAYYVTHIIQDSTCTDTFVLVITINPVPSVSFTSNAPVCVGTYVNFTNTGSSGVGYSYAWDFGSGAAPQTSSAQNPSAILYSSPGIKTITQYTTNQFGCISINTNTISVSSIPDATFSFASSACTGANVNFYSNTTASVTHSWSFGPNSSPSASTQANPSNIVYSIAGSYYITHIVDNGTCTDTSIQTITVNPSPAATFTSNAPACVGSAINFTNTGSSGLGFSYSWDFGAGANPATSAAQNPTGIIYFSGGTPMVTQYITNQFGCTTINTGTIAINSLPNANAGVDTVICAATSVQIGSNPVAGNSYNWFPSGTLSNSAIANPTASPVAPVTDYMVTVTDAITGCINKDTVTIVMLSPVSADAGSDAALCFMESVQIGSSAVPDMIYSWTPSTGLSSDAVSNPLAAPSDTITYVLTVTDSLGCGPAVDSVTIIIHPLPDVYAGMDDTITLGSSTQLSASGGIQYTWTPQNYLSNWGIYNPVANPILTTTYVISATDVFGCANTDSITIYVIKPDLWLPAGFTPDNNGHNDVLYVRGEEISNFEFGIFNRWGERIFFTSDIKQGWDGNRQPNGEIMPEGAYVYFIKGIMSNGDILDENGMVNLIR